MATNPAHFFSPWASLLGVVVPRSPWGTGFQEATPRRYRSGKGKLAHAKLTSCCCASDNTIRPTGHLDVLSETGLLSRLKPAGSSTTQTSFSPWRHRPPSRFKEHIPRPSNPSRLEEEWNCSSTLGGWSKRGSCNPGRADPRTRLNQMPTFTQSGTGLVCVDSVQQRRLSLA